MFSVLIPSYNHANYLEGAVRSALRSSMVSEVLMVDDGSSDQSPILLERIAKRYSDKVRLLDNSNCVNMGAHARLNQLVEEASNTWVAVLNSDDEFVAGRFELIASPICAKETELVFGSLAMMDSEGNTVSSKSAFVPCEFDIPEELTLERTAEEALLPILANQNYIFTTSNMIFTKELFERVGGFGDYRYCHDWDFALRASVLGKIQYIPHQLTRYRTHETNTINDNWRKVHVEIREMFSKFLGEFPHLMSSRDYSIAIKGNKYLNGPLDDEQSKSCSVPQEPLQVQELTDYEKHAYHQILSCQIFEKEYYINQLDEIEEIDDPLAHFIRQGVNSGKSPNKWIDINYYRESNPDLEGGNLDLLLHYIQHGFKEMRAPNRDWSQVKLPETMKAQLPNLVKHWIDSIDASNRKGEWLQYIMPRQGAAEASREVILLLGHDASRTGAPLLLLNLVKSFAEDGYECVTILKDDGPLVGEFLKHSHVINLSDCKEVQSVLELLVSPQTIERLGSTLHGAIANSVESLPIAEPLANFDLPLLYLVHELSNGYTKKHLSKVSQVADRLIFPAEFVKSSFKEKISVPESKTLILPQGLLDPNFGSGSRLKARQKIREQLGLDESAFIVLSCGTYILRKGLDWFVETAYKALKKEQNKDDIHFVWIGNGDESAFSLYYYCKLDIENFGITDNVHFTGEIIEDQLLNDFFVGSDLFLLASREDPFPCVCQMAMAAGTPLIAFDKAGGTPELLSHGGGSLASYGDTEEVAQLVLNYYNDRELLSQHGNRSRQVIRQKFKFEDYFSSLRELLKTEKAIDKSDSHISQDVLIHL